MEHILTETADRETWLPLAIEAAELASELGVRVRFTLIPTRGTSGFYGRVTTESPELARCWQKMHAARPVPRPTRRG